VVFTRTEIREGVVRPVSMEDFIAINIINFANMAMKEKNEVS